MKATVILFKPSGKYYTSEQWEIPSQEQVVAAGGSPGDSVGPYCMEFSPDFRRISGGPVLVDTQEPWGYPHLFPGQVILTEQVLREAVVLLQESTCSSPHPGERVVWSHRAAEVVKRAGVIL